MPDIEDLKAKIWKRAPYDGCPDGEWVLEIEGTAGDTFFSCRHPEPLTTDLVDVAGLPSLYATITTLQARLEEAERLIETYSKVYGMFTESDRERFRTALTSIRTDTKEEAPQ